jgi:IS1 family transposase
MSRLSREQMNAVIAALVEGASVRSVERLTGVHRDTILRLLVRVGTACEALMDAAMRDLPCGKLQLDEIWCYVTKKQRHLRIGDDPAACGDFWTFVAIDADTKLVPCFRVGKRDAATTRAFVADLADRLARRVQISTDGFQPYVEAIEAAFGGDVDVGQVVKSYVAEPIGPGRYSPPRVKSVETAVVAGEPDPKFISTSYVERGNLTMRMHMRRFTRLTLGFSKKPENLRAAVALHFAWYNFVRPHAAKNLRKVTPAMAAGVTNRFWTVSDLVGLIA